MTDDRPSQESNLDALDAIRETDRRSATEGLASRARSEAAKPTLISLWGWAVAAIGFVLVVALGGLLLSQAVFGGDSPPIISIRVDAMTPAGSSYLVAFTVTNQGDVTAAGLTVEGELWRGADRLETSSVAMTYVPGHSTRHGGLFLATDPRQLDVRLRATGYERP